MIGEVTPRDHEALYRLWLQPEVRSRWGPIGFSVSADRFVAALWDDVLCQFVVRQIGTADVIGLVRFRRANFQHQTCHLDLMFDPAIWHQGWHFEGVVLGLNHVFESFSMRKIYAEVPEFNYADLRSGQGRYFDVEGILREHEWLHNSYRDTYILAIHRNRHWDQILKPLLAIWTDKDDVE